MLCSIAQSHTILTGNMLEAPELGTSRYKLQNCWSQWYSDNLRIQELVVSILVLHLLLWMCSQKAGQCLRHSFLSLTPPTGIKIQLACKWPGFGYCQHTAQYSLSNQGAWQNRNVTMNIISYEYLPCTYKEYSTAANNTIIKTNNSQVSKASSSLWLNGQSSLVHFM